MLVREHPPQFHRSLRSSSLTGPRRSSPTPGIRSKLTVRTVRVACGNPRAEVEDLNLTHETYEHTEREAEAEAYPRTRPSRLEEGCKQGRCGPGSG
jgi:hypothetical protein